ncbi:hypothetical protein D2E25_0948 [Bifidobacterium goeldii]|uniref:Uncharacterized protein n=1 Tax=Bifidobacterium goeldii TaxID=2306975 RepID=A0A430FL41_9BIFI|nr:hypothetical protein D2E25_0948 [Bifidobacterium goeldii]
MLIPDSHAHKVAFRGQVYGHGADWCAVYVSRSIVELLVLSPILSEQEFIDAAVFDAIARLQNWVH